MLRKRRQYSKRLPLLSRDLDTLGETAMALEHEMEHMWRPIQRCRTDRVFIEKRDLAYNHLLAKAAMVDTCWLSQPWPKDLLTQGTSCWWYSAICSPDKVCDLCFPCFSLLAAHQRLLHCCWLCSVGNGQGIFNLISRLCGVFVFWKYGWNKISA